MKTCIERMTELDAETLVYLLKQAGEQTPEPNAGFFKDDKNILLVSKTGGQLSGFPWAYILDSPNSLFPKLLILYSIDVFEPYRRQGIATLLIQNLKEIARIHNCQKMWVPTSKTNLAAVALYRGTGGVAQDDDAVMFTYDHGALNA